MTNLNSQNKFIPRSDCHCKTRVITVKKLVILNTDHHKGRQIDKKNDNIHYLHVVKRVGLLIVSRLPGKAATHADESQ